MQITRFTIKAFHQRTDGTTKCRKPRFVKKKINPLKTNDSVFVMEVSVMKQY